MHITAHEHMLIASSAHEARLGPEDWECILPSSTGGSPDTTAKVSLVYAQNNVYIFACLYPFYLYPVDPCKNGKKRQVIEKQFIL